MIKMEEYVPVNLRSHAEESLIKFQGVGRAKPLADLRHKLEIGLTKHWKFGYSNDSQSFDYEHYPG